MAEVTGRGSMATLTREFAGYFAASAVALGVDVALLYLLTEQGLHYLLSATIAFLAGMLVVYVASVRWIFAERRHRRAAEITLFISIGLAGLLLNLAIVWIGTSVLGFYYLVSKGFSVACVFSWNFLARKFTLFTLPPV